MVVFYGRKVAACSLQNFCIHFAVLLHICCSVTAKLLQYYCKYMCSATAKSMQCLCSGKCLCINSEWGDPARFIEAYFSTYPGAYFTGDGARRDEDGYYWITGRVDDVLNISGHRLGTAEIESALVAHEAVAEAAEVRRRW
jgi:acyl-CoA synthetase (AMP-forming)/AMP-acid ligase II